jgi:hypothetical protein
MVERVPIFYLGSTEQLKAADARGTEGGWAMPGQHFDQPGVTYAPNRDYKLNDRISLVNSDKMNTRIQQQKFENSFELMYDNFGQNSSMRLAYTIMHEAGHSIFSDHPGMERNPDDIDWRHVPGEPGTTIMHRIIMRDSNYDKFMIDRLRNIYGSTTP